MEPKNNKDQLYSQQRPHGLQKLKYSLRGPLQKQSAISCSPVFSAFAWREWNGQKGTDSSLTVSKLAGAQKEKQNKTSHEVRKLGAHVVECGENFQTVGQSFNVFPLQIWFSFNKHLSIPLNLQESVLRVGSQSVTSLNRNALPWSVSWELKCKGPLGGEKTWNVRPGHFITRIMGLWNGLSTLLAC